MGRKKLLNAPTWKSERLVDGGIVFITTESPFIERAIAEEAELKLRSYLGEEYFFKRKNEQEIITRTELNERVFSNNQIESKGYIAPEFCKYYEL